MKGSPNSIRVIVVDDSTVARIAIRDALSRDESIQVVGLASDPYDAREKILAHDPDVVTLDLEMPRMDGLTFLKILREHHRVPVIVISSLSQAGSAKAMDALHAGAFDVLGKPFDGLHTRDFCRRLVRFVKAAASSNQHRMEPVSPDSRIDQLLGCDLHRCSSQQILLIGSSTGGVEALRHLLPQLPDGLPPIVVVQHIPATFSRLMAQHLDQLCRFTVREATDGEELRPGLCLIAPGDFHLLLEKGPRGYRVRLTQTPPLNYCRPSVDLLFRSAAEVAGRNAVAAILTGMGADGARGLLALRSSGAHTFAEHEESCVVYGMPQAAIKLNAATEVHPLSKLPQAILKALNQPRLL
jgi:two-component system chemotaxis response regulator CheB